MMGCDIHCHIEVKINGRWEHWSAPRVERDYALFARLADVRSNGKIKPIAQPRGVASDPSTVTSVAYKIDEPDAHSESWLTAEELEMACDEDQSMRRACGFGLGGNGFTLASAGAFPPGVEDFRLIFWFDN